MLSEGWGNSNIGELVDILPGYAFKSANFSNDLSKGKPIIRIRDIQKHFPETVFTGDYLDTYLVNSEDILIGMDGDFHICRWNGPESLLNQRVCKIWSKKQNELNDLFLFYRLQPELINLNNSIAGTTVKHLSTKHLRNLEFPLPPLPEQNKIAAILSSVDDAIQATQAVIDQTRRVKQGLLQQLLTRGIGHGNFKEKEINVFPKGWKWVNLGDVTNESKRRNDGSFSDNDLYAVTKINGIIPMRERVRGKNLDRCKVVIPTAFAYNPMRLNIGSIAQWGGDKPVIVSPDYIVFECDSSKINSFYLNYIRKSHAWTQFMDNAGNGSVRIRIYYRNLADFQFLLPPLLEQKQIVTILKRFDEVLKVEQEKLEQTLILKRGLMQDLLTGRVRVIPDEVNTT